MTPKEQAAEARSAVVAGAGAIHVHARDRHGRESLAPHDIAGTLEAIRAACPGIPVGASTGAWILPELDERVSLIRAWEILPDFASVNLHEEGATQIIRLLLDKGIGVEAGIWNARAAQMLLDSGLTEKCLRILLEPADDGTDVYANLAAIEAALGRVGPPRLLHGVDASAWSMVELAAKRVYDTRTGFEDVLTLPDGSRAESNAALITVAQRIVAESFAR